MGRIFKITGSYKDRRKVEFSGKIVVEKDNGFMGACVEKETAQKVHIVGAFATNQRRGHKGEKGISFYYSTDNTGFPSYSFITPDLKNPAHSAIRVYELNQGWTDIGRYSIKVEEEVFSEEEAKEIERDFWETLRGNVLYDKETLAEEIDECKEYLRIAQFGMNM